VVASIVNVHNDTITLHLSLGNDSWFLTGMYASPVYSTQVELWSHLTDLKDMIAGPWFIIRDFNEILLRNEQRGGKFNQTRADVLFRTMDSCQLLDISRTGGKFTWARNCVGKKRMMKRLDRVVVNMSWRLAFPDAYIEVVSKFHSDHHPLFLPCNSLNPRIGPRPFRFEASWITPPDYQSVVERSWENNRPSPVTTLNHVRNDSLIFNSEVFGNIRKRKTILKKRIKGLQLSLERVDFA